MSGAYTCIQTIKFSNGYVVLAMKPQYYFLSSKVRIPATIFSKLLQQVIEIQYSCMIGSIYDCQPEESGISTVLFQTFSSLQYFNPKIIIITIRSIKKGGHAGFFCGQRIKMS